MKQAELNVTQANELLRLIDNRVRYLSTREEQWARGVCKTLNEARDILVMQIVELTKKK